jgi:hypothetical protein
LQGKELERSFEADAPQVPTINHPDVRRMLLDMKAYVEGMRTFVFYLSFLFDKAEVSTDEVEKKHAKSQVELLTPIVKAYCTDMGFKVCVDAMQVYGGYGYTREYPIEQLVRDCKIASIYEGTNGIQAMDLLARKMSMEKGMVFMTFLQDIQKTIAVAKSIKGLEDMALKLEEATNKLGEVAMHIGSLAMKGNFRVSFAFATPLLKVMGDTLIGWLLLMRSTVALPKFNKIVGDVDQEKRNSIIESNKDAAFYEGVVKASEHFIFTIIPETIGKMNAIQISNSATVAINQKAFGS